MPKYFFSFPYHFKSLMPSSSSTLHAFIYSLAVCLVGKAEVNVALNSRASYCNTRFMSSVIVDGNTNITSAEIVDSDCFPNAFIKISLGGIFFVHYVIVYEGAYDESYQGQLDYFWIYTDSRLLASQVCSEFPMPSWRDKKPMRVNCKSNMQKTAIVELRSRQNYGLNIVEIEVYTFASGESEENVLLPRGCFSSFPNDISTRLTDYKFCKEFCSSKHYPFLAIKDNSTCFCGYKYNEEHEVVLRECRYFCTNSDVQCGGNETYSVYLVYVQLPYHFGCKGFSGSDTTAVKTFENLTVSKCLHHCENQSDAVMTGGSVCLCNIEGYNMYQWAKSCNSRCSGDSESFCGGERYASVYKTCTGSSDVGTLCTTLFRCLNTWNEYGVCTGGCVDGYVGDHCLEKEIIMCVDIDPCVLTPNSECLMMGSSYTCECLPGFEDNGLYPKTCTDVDECVYEPCDTRASQCENTLGSFVCICKLNFFKSADEICIGNGTDKKRRFSLSVIFNSVWIFLPVFIFIMLAYKRWSLGDSARTETSGTSDSYSSAL